jgi:hypothetical protein
MKNINTFNWVIYLLISTVIMFTISSCISGNRPRNNRTVIVKNRGVYVPRANRNSLKLRVLRRHRYR